MKNISWFLIILFCLVLTACGGQTNKDPADLDSSQEQPTTEKESSDEKQTVELDVEDVSNSLPITTEITEYDMKLQSIAYRLWFDLMEELEANGQISDAFYTRFHVLEGDEKEFVAAVVFQVQLEEVSVDRIVWKLHVKKEGERTYTLERIEPSADIKIGLPPVQSMEEYQKEVSIEVPSDKIRYEIVNNTLKVMYNNGADWTNVPVTTDELFGGEYNGSERQLIEGSYVISPERTAFVIGGDQELRLLLSTDQGETWDEVTVTNQIIGVRMRQLGFTSAKDGYLIISSGRTMSSEGNSVYKTNDGGKSWNLAGSVKDEYSLVTGGGFVNDQLGFISFGAINVEDQQSRPQIYRTDDGGDSWEEIKIPIPEEYKGIFTVAEIPVFNGTHGTLLVNQGPNGDYLGGKVLAKFTSEDEGKTWSFASLVDPDRVLLKDF
ncbi:WD40/YVTN/BNR-like repeat-containing protein [Virgibacillus ndiopensis]|uniref:WD40/YVTN/BNR-like repeat-containing protein n=1 Tax=Virgibacillus ndiopensis TaxID=2004408 RepID=UPI000C086AA8|nr:sialidase family protein [Virgibacillus ndiopensis]